MTRPIKPVIFGCQGYELTAAEQAFFKEQNPLGLMIYARNIKDPEQLKKLISSFRRCVGRQKAPVLVDQEGGTVQRLKPPYWTKLPCASDYGLRLKEDKNKAIRLLKKNTRILAEELLEMGLTVDCWPCLDVEHVEHNVMVKRCYSDQPEIVAELGQIAIDTALEKGLMPIVKHIPGYGRVTVDPHHQLPVVKTPLKTLESSDFYPFRQVDRPIWGMTAHVIYTALDRELPATLSRTAIDYIRHRIGFNGFLICDDMAMGALSAFGTQPEIAKKILNAGCDAVLHCSGVLSEMQAVANELPPLLKVSQKRLKQAEDLL